MQLNPYLHFNGQCEEAFKFYEKCLGGKITFMMPHEGPPVADQVPQEWGKKILHATLNIGEAVLQGADSPPRPAAYLMLWRKTEPCRCRSRKHSGLCGLAWSLIGSASRG